MSYVSFIQYNRVRNRSEEVVGKMVKCVGGVRRPVIGLGFSEGGRR